MNLRIKKSKFDKTSKRINKFNNNLLSYYPITLLPSKKMLTNVTNMIKNRQLLTVTCFVIHVGKECIGEKTYA